MSNSIFNSIWSDDTSGNFCFWFIFCPKPVSGSELPHRKSHTTVAPDKVHCRMIWTFCETQMSLPLPEHQCLWLQPECIAQMQKQASRFLPLLRDSRIILIPMRTKNKCDPVINALGFFPGSQFPRRYPTSINPRKNPKIQSCQNLLFLIWQTEKSFTDCHRKRIHGKSHCVQKVPIIPFWFSPLQCKYFIREVVSTTICFFLHRVL